MFPERSVDRPVPIFIRGQIFFSPAITDLRFYFSFSTHQVVYFTEMYKIFSELTDQIDQAGLTDEQRERETEAKLTELRALSIVADDWVRKIQKRALFMPLWMDCALFKLLQSSNGQQWPKPDYPFVSLRPHPHPQLLLHYTLIFHHLSNSKQLNATLTKPSAKCNIISQYVVVYFSFLLVKESDRSCQN